jgi:redox-sensitive bicupin YhaK (pirin superfamily)
MIRVRRGSERGHFDHGWLKTYHTFSFGDYYDPAQMGFRVLRVINEDWVAPGQGFGMHPHLDMEIVTVVLEGQLAHRDSLGTGSVIRPGEVQRMTAGTGIRHSEFNPSPSDSVHLYQIWLLPDRAGHTPSYEQRSFTENGTAGELVLVASPDGRYESLTIQQDAQIFLATLGAKQPLTRELAPGRHAWVQVLRGRVALNGHELAAGDGAAVSAEPHLTLTGNDDGQVLLFDLP